MQLQLRLPETNDPRADVEARTVAGISLGWYRDGDTRHVAAVNTTTRHEDAIVVRLPPDISEDLQRVENWMSARDTARDAMVVALKALVYSDATDLLAARMSDLAKLPVRHVASARLAALVLLWRDGFADYQPEVLAQFEAWRHFDVNLFETSAHVRRRTLNRRRVFYQGLAARWVKQYHTIVMHELDLAHMARIKDAATGEHTELNATARAGRYVAALAELENAIKNAAAKAGTRVINISAGTALICSVCGSPAEGLKDAIECKCTNCGEMLEKRTNAASNLVRYFDLHQDDIARAVTSAQVAQSEAQQKRVANKAQRAVARSLAAQARRAEDCGTKRPL